MRAEELAARHPWLFHLTAPANLPGILRHGLLATSELLTLFEVPDDARAGLEAAPRPDGVVLRHPVQGHAALTDNRPLSVKALAGCLEEALAPAAWLRLLNRRVFFWADEAGLQRLLDARLNRGRERAVLVLDTLGVVHDHAEQVELSAINSGATMRRPARRGLATFTPLAAAASLGEWRRLRGGRDDVREVTVLGGVRDVARYLVEVREVKARGVAPGPHQRRSL